MRGEVCIGTASLLSLAAMVMLIFVHIGQINTSKVPHSIYMARVNASGYGKTLERLFLNDIQGLYTSNSSAPLQTMAGLRQIYEFGLYAHCAYVVGSQGSAGICSNTSVAHQFRPYDYLKGDMAANYSAFTDAVIPSTPFKDSNSLGQSSKSAYYLILLGTICAGLAFLIGLTKRSLTFTLSSTFAGFSSLFLLVGAALWTVIIKKSDSINSLVLNRNTANATPLDITMSIGIGLYLVWASFACIIASMIPYMISCCTYRG